MPIKLFPILFFLFFISCEETKTLPFSETVENAHLKGDFIEKEAIQFDLNLSFGGRQLVDGTMTLLTNSSKGLLKNKDGVHLYFDNANIYVDTALMSLEQARFSAYTWSYFFLLPYKLNDSGTNWITYEDSLLNDKVYDVEKLTFEAGTGDAPDDWYIVYADKKDHLIEVAAYIVTAGGSTVEEAEIDPHAIEYQDYKAVDGIPIAHKWLFHAWRKEGGLTEQLGEASLSNVKFTSVDSTFFIAPKNFTKG